MRCYRNVGSRRVTALLCLTTCPDRDSANRIARALVDERLAACVNILPAVTSVYRWRGACEQVEEIQLVIKTTHAALASLKTRLPALHPYDVPELVAIELVDGLPAYLGWLEESTGADPGEPPA